MIEVFKTDEFARWIDGLRDVTARARIQARIERLAVGNAGDVRPVGSGVSEMRVHFGPGYRIYFAARGRRLVVLFAGGDKNSQAADIRFACILARGLDG